MTDQPGHAPTNPFPRRRLSTFMSIPTWVWLGLAVVAAVLVVRQLRAGSAEGPQWVAEGAVLVDVRTASEFAGGHLNGAINIPVQEIDTRWKELDPAVPVVVYCAAGVRAARAKSILEKNGFGRVLNGGAMSSWAR